MQTVKRMSQGITLREQPFYCLFSWKKILEHHDAVQSQHKLWLQQKVYVHNTIDRKHLNKPVRLIVGWILIGEKKLVQFCLLILKDSKIFISMGENGGLRCIMNTFLYISCEVNAIDTQLIAPHPSTTLSSKMSHRNNLLFSRFSSISAHELGQIYQKVMPQNSPYMVTVS